MEKCCRDAVVSVVVRAECVSTSVCVAIEHRALSIEHRAVQSVVHSCKTLMSLRAESVAQRQLYIKVLSSSGFRIEVICE